MQFERAARTYCRVIDRAASKETQVFIAEVAAALADLVAAASKLPDDTPSDRDLPDRPTDAEAKSRYEEVDSVLGELAWYSTTLAPYGGESEEAVTIPLADDLIDIWRDVKAGLLGLEGGAASNDVIWEWRFGFYALGAARDRGPASAPFDPCGQRRPAEPYRYVARASAGGVG